MNPTRTRGIILNKIKQALSKKKNNLQEPDFSLSIFHKKPDDSIIVFAENFVNNNGEFIYCDSFQGFLHSLNVFIQKKELKNIFIWEEELFSLIKASGVSFQKNDKDSSKAEVGITSCESLIARTGSIVVSSANRSGRRLSILPPIHIVIAFTSQVVEEMENSFSLLKSKYSNDLPSMISVVTGPSKTADIENTLVLGAHGPKELVLFLIDDTQY